MEKYGNRPLRTHFESLDDINRFAIQFYRDAAEIYDYLTRVTNRERNPSGYSFSDAPIIGLLVRIWKLFKETIRYHTENNAEFIAIFQRTLLETAVTATYLLKHDADCSGGFQESVPTRTGFESYETRRMEQHFRRLRRGNASCAP